MARIIAFANQKGGVGKTTLLTLFAHYLIQSDDWHDIPLVVDADTQGTLNARRRQDEASHENEALPFRVFNLNINNNDEVMKFLEGLNRIDDATVLVDTPGNISGDGLANLFLNTDWIIIPFQYEENTWLSMLAFIEWLGKLKSAQPMMRAKIILVPNNIKKGVGTVEENKEWADRKKALEETGKVAPTIWSRQDITRYDTWTIYDQQLPLVKETFDYIIKKIKSEDND